MDPTRNPFTPGAGFRPPELAGRTNVVGLAEVGLAGLQRGQPTRPVLLFGLRGVGKTVLLNVIEEKARAAKCHVIAFEATDKVGLGEALVPELQRVLARLSTSGNAKQLALSALNAVRDFVAQLELSYGGAKVGVKGRNHGAASSGSLEVHLKAALIAVGEAARAAGEPVVLLVDEIQYLHLREEGRELGALISALHRVGQLALPIGFFGAGLPQIHGIVTKLRSYSERFFQFMQIGPLDKEDALRAIRQPILDQHESVDEDALAYIHEMTRGYPYYLQEYGRHAWLIATESPITLTDAQDAHVQATADLDQGFFEARMQRITEREKDYVYAMASIGAGPYASAAVAKAAGEAPGILSPFRDGLIKKGIIWVPQRGEVEFSVPMFDAYLRRQTPTSAVATSPSISVQRTRKKKREWS